MATAFADLIQAGLETADVEKSNNFSATEKARIANESLSAVYDFIVAKWQEYFALAATFTLPPANAITLSEITSGIAPPPAFPVATPVLAPPAVVTVPDLPFGLSVNASTALQFFAVNGSSSFASSQGFKPPAGRVLKLTVSSVFGAATAPTLFAIYKESVATTFTVVMNIGDTLQSSSESLFAAPLHFNGNQVLDVVAQESGTPAGWSMHATLLYQLDQPPTQVYKELGLTRTQTGIPETITPLPGYSARNDIQDSRRRYWLQGQTLSLWPQFNGIDHSGTYVLDYIPNCPVMVDGDLLPSELERWKELITVVMAIKFLIKRKQSTVDMEKRQQHLEQAIVIAASSRKSEARQMRPLYRHDVTPWGTWQNPLYPRR